MVTLISNVTEFQWRTVTPFIRSLVVEHAPSDTPAWATTIIRGRSEDVAGVVRMFDRMGHRFEGWKPRPVISDPTYAMAASRIDRAR